MAAQPWKAYNLAKKKIGNATLNLASTVFRITLHTSASNFATLTLGVYNSVTGEVTSSNAGYSTSGKALSSERWTVGGSAKQYMFDVGDVTWTATVNTIVNIKAAVIWLSAAASANRHLLCHASLTSTQFTLALNNTMTIQMATTGVMTLT